MKIANHGVADFQSHGAAERLDEPADADEDIGICENRKDSADQGDEKAYEQRLFPPDPVGHRAVREPADCCAEKKQGHHPLGLRIGEMELAGQLRIRGSEHHGCQGEERKQNHQDDDLRKLQQL